MADNVRLSTHRDLKIESPPPHLKEESIASPLSPTAKKVNQLTQGADTVWVKLPRKSLQPTQVADSIALQMQAIKSVKGENLTRQNTQFLTKMPRASVNLLDIQKIVDLRKDLASKNLSVDLYFKLNNMSEWLSEDFQPELFNRPGGIELGTQLIGLINDLENHQALHFIGKDFSKIYDQKMCESLRMTPSTQDTRLEGGVPSKDKKQIEKFLEVNKIPEGVERIERISTINAYVEILEKRLELLKAQKNGHPEPQKINAQIAEQQEKLNAAKNTLEKGSDWINSNYYRNLVNTTNPQRLSTEYIAAPTNLRYQSLSCDGKRVGGFCRLGVISDMRNGWISLKEMRQLEDLRNKGQNQEIDKFLSDRQKHLKKTLDNHVSGNFLRRMMTKVLHLSPPPPDKKQLAIQKAIDQLESLKKPEFFDAMLNDRAQVLKDQFLVLLNEQVQRNGKTLGDKAEFELIHLALLNPKKDVWDSTGWNHNERVEIEDMYQIFKEFRGKTIHLEKGTKPYIDPQGHIHLPAPEGAPPKLRLQPYLINISVQGHEKNDGIQRDLNNETVKNGKNPLISDHLLERFEKGESNYFLAEDVFVDMMQNTKNGSQRALSMGCLSAKDRTSFVASRAILKLFKAKKPHIDTTPLEEKIMDKDSTGSQVVYDNTRKHYLKVSPPNLPGIPKIKRMVMYLKQLTVI